MAVYKRTQVRPDGTEVELPFYYYRFHLNGVTYRKCTKQENKEAAKRQEAAHRTRVSNGEVGIIDQKETLKTFEKRFLKAIATRKPQTASFYESKLKGLLAFKPMANAKLNRIDEALIQRWIERRLEDVAPATVNRGLATLRRLLRMAYEFKLIQRVPHIRLLPGEKMREFVLVREKERDYFDACPQPLKDVALFLLDTGLRVGEALALRWADVTLDPTRDYPFGSLRVRRGKSKAAQREIGLTERVRDVLKAQLVTDEFVFCNGSGKPYRNTHLAHMHAIVRDKLGWPEMVLHSLRHSFGTRLKEAGADVFDIMKIMGHSTPQMSARYVKTSSERVGSVFARLNKANSEFGPGMAHEDSAAA